MQAIILAAGMGKRLQNLTQNNTKCMVEVNGVKLIDRMLNQLESLKLSKIIVVVGYKKEKLIEHIDSLNIKTPVVYVANDVYDKTNNIYSLYLAKEYMIKEDTLLLESDLIVEDKVFDLLLNDNSPNLVLADKYKSWMDGTCLKIDNNNYITAFIEKKTFNYNDIDEYYKTVNIYKFSKDFSLHQYVPFLEAYVNALGNKEYYEQVLKVIILLDNTSLQVKKLNNELWYEIDDAQDLDIAESMFCDDIDEKIKKIHSRFGGFWRYDSLIDYCYLVNPYFPPKKLIAELEAKFVSLLTQYPSGQSVNSLLAAKNFGVRKEHIVVGNGAAELIKSLVENLDGNIGYVRPTFEEYPNRNKNNKEIVFTPTTKDFSYTADDIIKYFGDKEINHLLLINPDNPSGNYIKKDDVLKLALWSRDRNITFIVDESFVDFATEEDNSLINEEIITSNSNLIIVKSISKSYGVPGLRLGVLVSSNDSLISRIKKDVSIWNINSFAEYYLQIAGKYESDYANSLIKIKAERARFVKGLSSFNCLEVFPSEANYVMIELLNIKSKDLMNELYDKYNILIKDLSDKVALDGRQFIRLAIRNEEDNNKMLSALSSIFEI